MERADLQPGAPGPTPPAVAAVLSLIVPGLGQVLHGRRERGMAILLTVVVVVGLILWLERLPLLVGLVPFWLWNARDALAVAQGVRPNTAMLLFWAALPVYAIGWLVTDIHFDTLIRNAPKVGPLVSGLFRPSVIAREVDLRVIPARLQVPCGAAAVDPVPPSAEGATLTPSQPCGAVGTELTLAGAGFPPGQEVSILWVNPVGEVSRVRVNGGFEALQTDAAGRFTVALTIPQASLPRADQAAEVHQIEARYVASQGGWYLTDTFWLVVNRMGETIAQALMATFVGSVFAAAISFFGARNLMGTNRVTQVLYYVVRMLMNILRSVEPLIMAIVFVVWVGLGPFAGVLALIVHTIAALGKLYSEAIESIDPGPIEALRATGANQLQMIAYAVVPQVLPPWIAFTVYRWDINVRMSTIIGFVGGGGIGFLLAQWIRLTDFQSAGAAIWAIALVVMLLDYVSAQVRERVV